MFGYEGGEAEEAEAGDKDGQGGEDGGEVAGAFFFGEFGSVVFADEAIDEGAGGVIAFEDGFHAGDGGMGGEAWFYADDDIVDITAAHEEGGLDGIVGVVGEYVLNDADADVVHAVEVHGQADGVFDANEFCCCFVDDEGAGVGGEIAGEVAAFDDGPADRATVIGGDVHVAEHLGLLVLAFAGPVDGVAASKTGWCHIRGGDIVGQAILDQFGTEGFVMFLQLGGIDADVDESFAGIADGPVFYDHDLAEDDDGPDDEAQGDGELEDDEDLAGQGSVAADLEGAFEHLDGPEVGQVEGGVAAGEEAGDRRETQGDEPEEGVSDGQSDVLGREVVEIRYGKGHDQECEEEGDKGDQDGFAEELGDELVSDGADGFADADLFCAFFASGGREVHEIDAREEEDEGADDTEEPDEADSAGVVGVAFGRIVIQVFPVEGVDEGCFAAFLDMGGREEVDACGGLSCSDAGRQFDVQVLAMVIPVGAAVVVLVFFIIPGHDELSIVKGGVMGEVGVDGADTEDYVVVDLDAFADGVGVAEEAGGQGLGDDCSGGVFFVGKGTAEELEAKHGGKCRLGPDGVAGDGLVAGVDQDADAAVAILGGAGKEVFVLGAEGCAHDIGDHVAHVGARLGGGLDDHAAGDAAVVGRVVVEAAFVLDPEPDEEGNGHAGGEAGDIDKAIAFLFDEMAPGEAEIVFYHGGGDTKIMPFV